MIKQESRTRVSAAVEKEKPVRKRLEGHRQSQKETQYLHELQLGYGNTYSLRRNTDFFEDFWE